MPPSQPTSPSNGVLLERLENVACDVREVRDTLNAHATREQEFEKSYIRSHEQIVANCDQNTKRIDRLEGQLASLSHTIDELQRAVQPLIATNKILTWLAIALGGSIVALIWGILMHQVTVSIP